MDLYSGPIFSYGLRSPDCDYDFDIAPLEPDTSMSWCSTPGSSMFSDDSNSSMPGLAEDLIKKDVIYQPTTTVCNYDQENRKGFKTSDTSGVKRDLFGSARNKGPLQEINTNIDQSKTTPVVKRLKTWCGTISAVRNENKGVRSQDVKQFNIENALHRDDEIPDLIGDFSSTYALPLLKYGKHEDLKAISHETMRDLLNGYYSNVIDSYAIVDCRYPYEYEGGHIIGAKNLYTSESIKDELLNENENILTNEPGKRRILIFHCEFSSERGPKMLKALRNMDRRLNENNYPKLVHPEIYLLEKGYKDFFANQPYLCQPRDYTPMIQSGHESELAKYKLKSKSFDQSKPRKIMTRQTNGSTKIFNRRVLSFVTEE